MSVRACKPILPAHSALWWRRRDPSFGLWRRALWSRALGRALRVGVLRSYGCRARVSLVMTHGVPTRYSGR